MQIRLPTVLRFSGTSLVIGPGQIPRHGIPDAGEHVIVLVRVIVGLEVGAVGVRCRKVNLEQALDHNGDLNLIGMAGTIAEGHGEQRELAFIVVPIGGCAELHAVRAVAHNRKRRGLSAFHEGFRGFVKLELLGFGRDVLLARTAVQANRIGKAAVGYQVKVIGYGCGVLARDLKDRKVRGNLLRGVRVLRVVRLSRGSPVTVGVLVSARIITTADIGVGVTAGNVFARLVLNGRSQVNVRTVAEEVAVGGVGVGHAHGDLVTHRTRSHIR